MSVQEDFTASVALIELFEPSIKDWEFFMQYKDIKVYRKHIATSGLYEYKMYGTLPDVAAQDCAGVYMDLEYRKLWDSYVQELHEVSTEGDSDAVYWQVKYPWPLANRDYVYQREYSEAVSPVAAHPGTVHIVVARGVPATDSGTLVAERRGVIRVNEYFSVAALTQWQPPAGDTGRTPALLTKAFMHYYDNPGGQLPTWLINWAAKSGVPGFIDKMHSACKGYAEFKTRDKMSAS